MQFKSLVRMLFAVLVVASVSPAQQPTTAQAPSHSVSGSAIYGRLPLTFEANQGQTSSQVNFLSRGKGYTAFLTTGGMVLTLRPTVAKPRLAPSLQSTTLTFRLVGANKNPVAVGEEMQPGRVNYFIGNDPAQWRTKVPTYAKVRYKNVYPGIDLIYYGNHQQLEYDFSVSPGSDPRMIQFEIQGAAEVRLDPDGNLVLTTTAGDLHFQSPIVYQESNGQRIPVDGGYAMKDATHIGFEVTHYDSSKPLVIDPVLLYSTYLGGSGTNQPTGIAVDNSGNVYVTGFTDSADFPLANLGTLPPGIDHVFVAKLDASGSNLIYADYIGGNSQDYGYALGLDSANEVYVTGSTQSSNFPTVQAYQGGQPGPFSGFVTKISADGSSLLYSTYLGGNTFDLASSIAIDALNEVHIAGFTMSTNFPVANAYQSQALANQDGYGIYGFLTKFSTDGSSLVYSTYFAGNNNTSQAPFSLISAVALDSNGNAYVTGATSTSNFPVTSGAYLQSNTAPASNNIGFVSKFGTSGNLDYSTYFYGSSGSPVGINSIAVDSSGSAYVAGTATSDGTFPITSTSICDPNVWGSACGTAFVTKFDATGSTLLYSTFLGPNNSATPLSIALDADNDAYVAASTSSSTFGTVEGIEPYTNGLDLLLVEIDPLASTQLLATYMGGSEDEVPTGIAIDGAGNMYVAGWTDSSDFPTTQAAFQNVTGGNVDGFIAKIGPASAPSVSLSPYSLQFSSQAVGSTSQAQTVLLRNMGSSSMSISSITANGDFSETDDCGNSVPAAGNCTLSVTFTPTAPGTRSGSVVIQDDAAGSPHSINLVGIGSGATVVLSPASLTFSSVPLRTSSIARTVTLTNNGNATLNISNIQVTGDYAQTNNCSSALAASSSCAINLVFTPTASGTRSGTLAVSDSAQNSPQTVSLSGTGADFGISASPTQNTVNPGAKATYTLTVSSVGGTFSKAISFNCSGLPASATCSFSPGSVTPGANGGSSTLTITTTASSAQVSPARVPGKSPTLVATWIQLQGLGLFGLVMTGFKKRTKRLSVLIMLVLLVAGSIFMTGCAGGTGVAPQPTSPTSYSITVTGSYGSLQHSAPLTLTVQ
jgi:hypothetical protein